VPPVHYPDGVVVDVSAGNAVHDEDAGVVRWTLDGPTAEATLILHQA